MTFATASAATFPTLSPLASNAAGIESLEVLARNVALSPGLFLNKMLYHKCTSIHFRPIEDHPLATREALDFIKGSWPDRQPLLDDKILLYLHSVDLADLIATADQGCHFCITIHCPISHNETRFQWSFALRVESERIFLAVPIHICGTDKELARSEIGLHSRPGGLR
jgi:hypothetical protein